jgi:hypothetical protein
MFKILAAVLVACSLIGCGSEVEEPAPPTPEVVVVREVCTVYLLPDGGVVCKCEPKPLVTP